MEKETFTIRSSISSSLMRKTLMRGTVLGGIGALTLLYAGIFLPLQQMKMWGPILFLFGLGMITWGLFPYKRLKRLEEKPNRLDIEGDDWLHFSAGEKSLFSIPMVAIDHLTYIEKSHSYGIGLFLKNPIPQKIIINDSNVDIEKFIQSSRKQYGCDLFLSYFSQRSYEMLNGFVQQ